MLQTLNLEEIKQGCPGLSKAKASFLFENCIVTLHRQKHNIGCNMAITGDENGVMQLSWPHVVDDQLQRTYADQQEATEHAAECMAIMLALKLTKYTVVERSVKGTGIDYWLGEPDDILFQSKARLEVSGTFDGDEKELEKRFNSKCKQTKRSDGTALPAYVSVTAFKIPQSKFAKKP